jgi:hypothetical protein
MTGDYFVCLQHTSCVVPSFFCPFFFSSHYYQALFWWYFETESRFVAQAGLEFTILLLQLNPECYDYSCEPLCLDLQSTFSWLARLCRFKILLVMLRDQSLTLSSPYQHKNPPMIDSPDFSGLACFL